MHIEIMDSFDGSVPNLISKRTLEDIDSYLNIPYKDSENKVINGLGAFYNNYISPNLFPIIVITLLIIYLTIKYILKRDREEKELIEDEKEEKQEKLNRVKNHVLKTNHGPESKTPYQTLIHPQQNIINNPKNPNNSNNPPNNQNNVNEIDISELISDEYLLTNDSGAALAEKSGIMKNDEKIYEEFHEEFHEDNLDKAAALIFNK
jgi:hypothetical protein